MSLNTRNSETVLFAKMANTHDAANPIALEEGHGGADKKKFIESDAGDGSKREDHYLHGVHLVLCLLSIYGALLLVALDQTIIVTLLSEVGNKFNALDKVGWLASGFLLTMAIFTATWGKISIIFGRKYTLLAAIVLFEAGSLMCALAPNMNVLIGGRVLAGIGGGGIQSLVFIIVSEVVSIEKRPLAMALAGCVFAIASVLGPLVGGAFTSHVSWRWCFYINLPIGGIASAFLVWAFNPPKPTGSLKSKLMLIDYFGNFLLSVGLVLFLLALTFGSSTYSWDSAAVICCFVIGILFVILFCVWNFRFSKSPIIPAEVVMIPQVTAAFLTTFAMFSYFMSCALYLSVYFQTIWGADAWHSGIDLLPMIIPVVISSIGTGILLNRLKIIKPIGLFGAILAPIGTGLLTLLDVDSSSGSKIGLLIVVGVSCGILMQSSVLASQVSAPKTPGGTIMATTYISFGRSFGGALGSILSDVVYNSSFKRFYKSSLANLTDPVLLEELSTVDVASISTNSSILKEISPAASLFIKQVMARAFRNVFYMCIGYACLALISCLFITNKRLPSASQGATAAAAAEKADTHSEPIEKGDSETSDPDSTN